MNQISRFFWLKQLLIQVVVYISLYELLKLISVIDFNLNLGITSKYLFYLFLTLSIILSLIILVTKKCNLYYIISFILVFIFVSGYDFFSAPKFMSLVWIISLISTLIAYYINLKSLH